MRVLSCNVVLEDGLQVSYFWRFILWVDWHITSSSDLFKNEALPVDLV